MQPFLDNSALRLYAVTSSVLAVQLILIALWVGTVRAKSKVYTNPEDAVLNKAEERDREHANVARVQKAHMNALENAVPFFIVGLLYALSVPSAVGAKAYFFTFLGARILHTFFYLRGLQPFRTICFVIGVLAVLGMAVHVVMVAVS